MQRVVIVYDIPSNKRRRLVSKVLEGYGYRVNRSVFECEIKNKKTLIELESELLDVLDIKKDSLRIYNLCENCKTLSKTLCEEVGVFAKESVYFV